MTLSCASSNEKTPIPNAALENNVWVLKSLNDKKIFIPETGKEIFITFKSQGKQANGNAGCNTFYTSYTVVGNQLQFGPVARTEIFCKQQMDTENNFKKALEAAERFKIKGYKLYFYDATKIIASFEASYNEINKVK